MNECEGEKANKRADGCSSRPTAHTRPNVAEHLQNSEDGKTVAGVESILHIIEQGEPSHESPILDSLTELLKDSWE